MPMSETPLAERIARVLAGAELSIELETQTVTDTLGAKHRFAIDAVYKERLAKGLDEVGMVLEHLPEIEAFEKKHHGERPWLA